jgi:hypothetical protein
MTNYQPRDLAPVHTTDRALSRARALVLGSAGAREARGTTAGQVALNIYNATFCYQEVHKGRTKAFLPDIKHP